MHPRSSTPAKAGAQSPTAKGRNAALRYTKYRNWTAACAGVEGVPGIAHGVTVAQAAACRTALYRSARSAMKPLTDA